MNYEVSFELVEARTQRTEGRFDTIKPMTDDNDTVEWRCLMERLHGVRPGHAWRRGIFDLEKTDRIWLVDELGRMTHYVEARPAIEKKKGGCPKCGHLGDFIRMALTCPQHGFFAGC